MALISGKIAEGSNLTVTARDGQLSFQHAAEKAA